MKQLIHEEKTQTTCVLRLFGAPLWAVQQAVQQKGLAAQCRGRGAEVLAALQAETPAGFWPALSEKLRAALPAKISGFFSVNGPIHPVLQGEVLIMAADSDFVLDLVKKTPDTEALVREKASAILGKPVSVRFALKNRLSRLGDDPMDALVQFGQQHSDIFTIK